jgi:hypothetical protein
MTTMTDEMTGAAIEAVWDAVKADNPPDGWTDWIDDRVMHAALEAAISVMPAPADAEFAAGLFSLSGSATRYGAETMSPRDDTDEWRAVLDALNTEVVEKRRTLLAMHAHGRIPGGAMMEARDVIAHLLHERHPFGYPATLSPFDDSDAILAALHDAGFVVARLDDVAQTVWFYDHQWSDGVHERLSDLIGDYDPRSSGKEQP